jgi:hypothetical protein
MTEASYRRGTFAERNLDLYQTPPCATEALLRVEPLPHRIWEPCAGRGAITDVLRKHGHDVVASDIVNYGVPGQQVADFLTTDRAPDDIDTIVTNPPFRWAGEFVEHALSLCPHVHMLLRLAFLESGKRTWILESGGLQHVRVFRRRLPRMHRDNWQGPRNGNSGMAFAWFTWNRAHAGPTTVHRISWEASS